MFTNHVLTTTAAGAALITLVAPALAVTDPVIFGVAGSPNVEVTGGRVVGFSAVSQGQTIRYLGFYDYDQDGLSGNHIVGLWDSSQNLITSVTITPASPLDGFFRWEPITPVTIGTNVTPDGFTIATYVADGNTDKWYANNLFVLLGVGYGGVANGQYENPAASLVYPTQMDSSGYQVVNGAGAIDVPEPGTLGVLMAGAAMLARRRNRK